ncbi:MAG: hypothetical protein ACD_20C00104G0004 [uncultured bacterium]|nr:MAG: hypothetical protein ACD_20C00104G0004 [uncultured bacterium]HBH18872.1 hypothetical protein [Cyanobacteria bacterium UBA9579]
MRNKITFLALSLFIIAVIGLFFIDKTYAAKPCAMMKNSECVQCITGKHDCCNDCKTDCTDCKQCCHEKKAVHKKCKQHCVSCTDCKACCDTAKSGCKKAKVQKDKKDVAPSTGCPHHKS